jgi:hypothetical protein
VSQPIHTRAFALSSKVDNGSNERASDSLSAHIVGGVEILQIANVGTRRIRVNEEVYETDDAALRARDARVHPFIALELVPRAIVHRLGLLATVKVHVRPKESFPCSAVIGIESPNTQHRPP